MSNTAEKMSDDTLFASVFRVSACSALVTYLLLCGLNSDVFLSLSFLKIVGVSILLLLFPGGIYCFTQHPVRTIAALFLFLLVVGTLDSDVLDACLVLLLTVVAGRDLISTKFWRVDRKRMLWFGRVILIPSLIVGTYNVLFVVVHVPELFSISNNLGGDPDWLFQLLLAKNVNQFGVVTTALDGAPAMQYHWLPYFLFSSVSNITGATLEQVLVLFFACFVSPMMMALVVLVATTVVQDSLDTPRVSHWIVAVLLFGGVLSSSIVAGGFYIGPYASVGVLFIFVFVLSITAKEHDFWSLFFVVAVLVLAKTPFGVMAILFLVTFAAIEYLKNKKIDLNLVLSPLLGSLFFLVFWFWLTNPAGDGSPFYPGNPVEFFHVRWMFTNSEQVTQLVSSLGLSNYRSTASLNIAIAIVAIYWPVVLALIWRGGSNQAGKKAIIVAAIVGFLSSGALSLRFFNGHHVYLAGFSALILIPFVIGITLVFVQSKKDKLLKLIFLTLILVFGVPSLASKLSSTAEAVRDITIESTTRASADEFQFLRELPKQREFADYLVYINPGHQFWHGCGPSKAFQIPLNASRPALRGLVYCQSNGSSWSAQNYYWWSYGYSAYSPDDFAKAQEPNPGKLILCREAREKGFSGYFDIQEDLSADPVDCN